VDNIEATNVLLPVYDDTCTTHVTAAGDHDDVASIKLDKVHDLALLEIELNGVVDLDEGIGVADSTTIVGDDVWDALRANGHFADLEELVGGLLRGDAMNGETSFDVVKQTEVLARLLDRDDVLETRRVGRICPDLAIDLDQTLHNNGGNLLAGQGILQPVAEENGEGEGFAELVGTWRWTGSVGSAQLVKHP